MVLPLGNGRGARGRPAMLPASSARARPPARRAVAASASRRRAPAAGRLPGYLLLFASCIVGGTIGGTLAGAVKERLPHGDCAERTSVAAPGGKACSVVAPDGQRTVILRGGFP